MITVYFNVTADLNYDESIYITLGVYAAKSDYELLYSVRAVSLCDTFVGHSCTQKGSYAFAFRATFDYLYGDSSEFIPVVEMGFSTKADEGYNLGGVNIDCTYDDTYEAYDPWLNGNSRNVKTRGAGSFAANYGILLGVVAMMVAFTIFASKKVGPRIEPNLDQMQSSFINASRNFGSSEASSEM